LISKFVVHRHKTGRPHFDLRVVQDEILRCWSLTKEPPFRKGERRLAIERESFDAGALTAGMFSEEAFGEGRVHTWDSGEVEISSASAREINFVFKGGKLSGRYRLRSMRWYPGNRWLLEKTT
jgi:bifunctional non-homologous end joining protein LigD